MSSVSLASLRLLPPGQPNGSAQAEARPAGRAAAAKTCPAGFVRAKLSWGEKCLKVGQYCRSKATASTTAIASTAIPVGLNCSDIPASKRPVRVTGDDPYRLDGDGDGWGCD
jgi:hypothetical protein